MQTKYGNSDKAIVFQDPNHYTCSIVVLVPGVDPEKHLEELKEKYIAGEYFHNPADARIINYPDDIPKDRIFRNAWTDANPTHTVDVDLNKAKVIHADRIRELRNKELEKTDLEFIKALSKGKDTSAISAEKQRLRDIPQSIEATISSCKTVEELKQIWPEDLVIHPAYKEVTGNE